MTDKELTRRGALARLRAYLDECDAGPLLDGKEVVALLADAWSELTITDHTNMKAEKLPRIENPRWEPPLLLFEIERHGATVQGSTRATAYTWSVNVRTGEASVSGEKRRQLHPMDVRLDVKPLVERLADAIVNGRDDEWLAPMKDGHIRIKISEIIPATNSWTTKSRRNRLRNALDSRLQPHGWMAIRLNVYGRLDG